MLVAIFIAFVFISSMNMSTGKEIGYPGMGHDALCDPKDLTRPCPPKQAVNPYTPGCEKSHRCRGGPPPPVSRKML